MSALLASSRTLSLAGAPSVWFVHFVAIYTLASFACPWAEARSPYFLSLTGIALLTLVALAVSGYAVAANLRKLRGASGETGKESERFLARANALLHALAIVAMVWAALPAFMLSPCAI
jgi:hypothetical protein